MKYKYIDIYVSFRFCYFSSKMIKSYFCFILKAFFGLKKFKILPWLFWLCSIVGRGILIPPILWIPPLYFLPPSSYFVLNFQICFSRCFFFSRIIHLKRSYICWLDAIRLVSFFGWIIDHTTFDVLFYILIWWIYTCQALAP